MKRYLNLLKEAFISVKSNLLRTFLTILGIVIGIFSVSGMLAVGDSVTKSVTNQFSAFSSGDIAFDVSRPKDRVVGDEILNWIKSKKFIKDAVGVVRGFGSITYNETKLKPSFYGVYGDYSKFKKYKLLKGELINFEKKNDNRKVAIVDQTFEKKFLKKYKKTPLGKTILYEGRAPIKIIGIAEFTGSFTYGDGNVYMPYLTSKNILEAKGFSKIAVNLVDSKYYKVIQKNIIEGINLMYKMPKKSSQVVYTFDNSTFIKAKQKMMSYFSWFLGAIGAIALLVGGIGTMNMILTTVSERKKEIGLRKAIGAKSSDITIQILLESIILTFTGGVIGTAFTIFIINMANKFIPKDTDIVLQVSYPVIILSIVISIIVGIIFGFSPARKAARMQPTEALRSE